MDRRVEVQGRPLTVPNVEQVLFPDGLTRGDLVAYYRRVSSIMLPHLEGRPLTMHRFPSGIDGPGLLESEAPEHFRGWVARETVAVDGGEMTAIICEDEATLVYLAAESCITLYVPLSRIDRPDYPDRMMFDLDPPGDDFEIARWGAGELRQLLEHLGLTAFVQTTGLQGLHVVVPLDRSAPFDEVSAFASDVARFLAATHPMLMTAEADDVERDDRLWLDTSANAYSQTVVAPYSVRSVPGAPVATPVEWDELRRGRLHARRYNIENLFRRLGQKHDAWAAIEAAARPLDPARASLSRLLS
jgi:bifunctional non-homologous end joining protein LigD